MRTTVVRCIVALLVSACALTASYVLVLSDLLAPARCAFKSRGLLVNSSKCQMPDIDAFDACSRPFINSNVQPIVCSSRPALTYTIRHEGRQLLRVASNVTSLYDVGRVDQLECCYSVIERKSELQNSLSACVKFDLEASLARHVEHVLVRCVERPTRRHVYSNVHAVVQVPAGYRPLPPKRRMNVMIVGLDSMSRLSLQRNMPQTVDYLHNTPGWFEMRGYSKVAKNTLPNLMAFLTGMEEDQARAASCFCSGREYDHCPFVWKDFKDAGYVTSYAEEDYWNTFNIDSGKGFKKKPTDFYMKPMIVEAAKRLRRGDGKMQTEDEVSPNIPFCLGETRSTDVILKHALDLLTTFQEAVFGFMWLCNFSHKDADQPSTEDSTMLAFFGKLNRTGALDNTMLVFLSDHGIRHGGIHLSEAGWYEFRLPFFFVHVPPRFCRRHPDSCRNLATNQDRLTSPFDLHATLKHVLRMNQGDTEATVEDRIDAIGETVVGQDKLQRKTHDKFERNWTGSSPGCPRCVSLFEAVDEERSCADAGVSDHLCTCWPRSDVETTLQVVEQSAAAELDRLNAKLLAADPTPNRPGHCALLHVGDITRARRVHLPPDTAYHAYEVEFQALPGPHAILVTVRHWITETPPRLEPVGRDNRVNYVPNRGCNFVKDFYTSRYCFCLPAV